MVEPELLLRARVREVEKELASVKIECQRLTRLEDEFKAIRNDFAIIRIEHENLKSDRKDIKDRVDSVDRCISECLDIVGTTAEKVQSIDDSVSDLQEKDMNGIVGTTSDATAGAHNGPSVPAEFVDFGAAFFQRMDEIQAEVLKKTDETNGAVLNKLDMIEVTVQLKLDRIAREEEDRQLVIEAKYTTLTHNQTPKSRQMIDAEVVTGIEKKMEGVLEHSMAVVSCETKLENLEKMISQSMGMKPVADIGNRLNAKLDGLEQRIVALNDQNVHEFIDIDQKLNVIMQQGNIHGLDNLVKLVSKIGTTMEAFDKPLHNLSISDTSLQNILQWVQSMNGKLVDMSGKIEALSGRGKDANPIQKAIAGPATKADPQSMAASFQNGRPGKDSKKDKPKLVSPPASGPSKPKTPQGVKPSTPAVWDRPTAKLATILRPSLDPSPGKSSTVALVPSPAVPVQEKSVRVEMTSEEMYKVHSAETVEQRAEHLAAYKTRVAEEEASKAKAETELQGVQAEAIARVEADSSEADVSESDSDDNALLVRFAEMKKNLQPSTPILLEHGLNLGKTGISTEENSPSSRPSSPASILNAAATDFTMPRSLNLVVPTAFDEWKAKTLPSMAHNERAKSPLKFADSY
ncbi:hypothetical protein EG328_003680 [Venturia inaequalis]|uniref:Uncharacterized protein n=1 Tax=Venturia inaequalis TaxID=5025 RepID=A0A8H3VWQ3_VENIN|nr:hypothetical protein EG328_003680 [Venturia inaequalis]KAE9994204.1 hypothetical protein EG327_000486 [Venturia inaequalis]RDI87260.1 hypothetical protein Vi05172_g2740 [Venturia inaequalis]